MDDGVEFDNVKERYDFWRGARHAAEELAWPISILAGWVAHAEGLPWWLSVPLAIGAFFLVARYFGRREESAEDAYERATAMGKYWRGYRSIARSPAERAAILAEIERQHPAALEAVAAERQAGGEPTY